MNKYKIAIYTNGDKRLFYALTNVGYQGDGRNSCLCFMMPKRIKPEDFIRYINRFEFDEAYMGHHQTEIFDYFHIKKIKEYNYSGYCSLSFYEGIYKLKRFIPIQQPPRKKCLAEIL